MATQDHEAFDRQIPTPSCVLTATEWRALCALRARYRQHRDLFSDGELTHLRFVRWLHQAGRLVP